MPIAPVGFTVEAIGEAQLSSCLRATAAAPAFAAAASQYCHCTVAQADGRNPSVAGPSGFEQASGLCPACGSALVEVKISQAIRLFGGWGVPSHADGRSRAIVSHAWLHA